MVSTLSTPTRCSGNTQGSSPFFFFFFNDTPPPEISPLPLHAALPISITCRNRATSASRRSRTRASGLTPVSARIFFALEGPIPKMYGRAYWIFLSRGRSTRSEEHTSELQSQSNLVCRLLLEKKKQRIR